MAQQKNKLAISRRAGLRLLKRKKINQFAKLFTGIVSLLPLSFLVYLFFTISYNTYFSLQQTMILVDDIDHLHISEENSREDILYSIKHNLYKILPEITIEEVATIFSRSAIHDFYDAYKNNEKSVWLYASSNLDNALKKSRIDHPDIKVAKQLQSAGKTKRTFNKNLFLNADSRDPTSAGVLGVALGSLFTILVCSVISIPLGVMTAFCVEELIPKNKFTNAIVSFLNISINNLASTPAIIYGIVGLLIFVNFFHLPRSSALVGGLTLSFMMLPTVVISTREAIFSIPNSIKEAAIAMGATKMQVILHHTLPLSIPLITTGSILGIARVIGESAPLLMIGMVAFVADIPHGIFEPTTVFPIQIFLWASSPEPALIEKTSAVIMLLFIVLLIINTIAFFIKKMFNIKFN